MNGMIKIKIILFPILFGMLISLAYPSTAFAEDDVMAIAEVKATFRKIVPRKINIGEINLLIPEVDVEVPSTGIYSAQFDGGELIVDANGKESVSKAITVTVILYIDVLEREPGIASFAFDKLISDWDEKKGKLHVYSVEMPPYDAAYHVMSHENSGKAPFEIDILAPAGDNFMIKILLSTNKENLNKDLSIKLAKDLLDILIRKAIDVEYESLVEAEEKNVD